MEKQNYNELKIENNEKETGYMSFTEKDQDGQIREVYGKYIEWPNEKEINDALEEMKKELGGHSR